MRRERGEIGEEAPETDDLDVSPHVRVRWRRNDRSPKMRGERERERDEAGNKERRWRRPRQ
jgi:hypothetical protein